MRIVMVGAEKGGVGKSTLNQNLAAIRASLGFRVGLYDGDRQGSSARFVERRREQDGLPEIHLRYIADLEPDIHARIAPDVFERDVRAFSEGLDVCFLDIGGKDTDLFRAALRFADSIIVPLTSSIQDLDTLPELVEVAQSIEDSTGRSLQLSAVLNQSDPRKRMTKFVLGKMGAFSDALPLLPRMIGVREAFKLACALGRGVHELKGSDADPLAANEMKDLYMEIFK